MKNYYAILEVAPDSDTAEIRESYRRLVQQNLWNKDTFAELKEAYEVLISAERRAEYDRAAAAEGIATALFEPKGDAATAPIAPDTGRRCPVGASQHCPVAASPVPLMGEFCPECGVALDSLPQRTVRTEDIALQKWFGRLEEETGRQHRLRIGESTVGREDADITLVDKTISRLHARLQSEDKKVILEDMGSTNGTQVNGERLAPHMPRPLVDGDTVRFGSIRTRYRAVDAETEGPPNGTPEFDQVEMPVVPIVGAPEPVLGGTDLPSFGTLNTSYHEPALHVEMPSPALNPLERLFRAPLGTAVNARAKLVATRGDMISEHPLIDGVTTFGRRADSTIVLRNDPYVSGSHAQIVGEGDVFRVMDVGSTNGTLLNGERLVPNQAIVLTSQDEIVIGGTIFRFEPNTAELLGERP